MVKNNILKLIRQSKKLSQENVARAVGISLRHYQKIESEISIPNVYLDLRIAKHLNIDPFQRWNMDKEQIGN